MRRFLASRVFLMFAVLALIAGADVLIYGHIPGWSLGLFLALLAGAILARTPRINTAAGIIALLIAGIIVALVIGPKFLSIILSMILIAALALFSRNPFSLRLVMVIRYAWNLFIGFFTRWFADRALMNRWISRRKVSRVSGARIVLGWVIPLFLGGIFILLFSQANPVLDLWLGKVSDSFSRLLRQLPDYVEAGRIFFWLVVMLVCWSLLRARRLRSVKWLPSIALPVIGHAPVALLTRCLLVFNIVFAVQSILDGTYLWGHAQLPQNMTYASYAHRGAYILVFTALLAAGFIGITFRQIRTATPTLRWLLLAWVVQNIFLMISTLLRLDLYVSVYSLTYWRIAAAIWILLIALGFAWFLLALMLRRDLVWLVRANLLTCFAVFYVCCFPSFAGLIADFNVRHCREMLAEPVDRIHRDAGADGSLPEPSDPRYRTTSRTTYDPPAAPLDLDYLVGLGPDALPALHWLSPRLADAAQRTRVHDAVAVLHNELKSDMTDWQSRTLRRHWLWRQSAE